MRVVGVDGCPGGWISVLYDTEAGTLVPRVHRSFIELLAAYPEVARIGVDIPIGLAEGEPRRCDVEARRVLGPRRSSVFPAPDRRVVGVAIYQTALARSKELTGKGISKQGFAIYPKVAEVDRAMAPARQERVFEVHPEVGFWALAGGRPMAHHKGKPEGYEERRGLLAAELGTRVWSRNEARGLARPAAPDDVLDATVAAWTACRAVAGLARRLPPDPTLDGRGLRMEIVY